MKEEWRRNGGLSDLDLAGGVGEGHHTHGEGTHGTDHVQASVGGSHWTGKMRTRRKRRTRRRTRRTLPISLKRTTMERIFPATKKPTKNLSGKYIQKHM